MKSTIEMKDRVVARGFSHYDGQPNNQTPGKQTYTYTEKIVEEGMVVSQWLPSCSGLVRRRPGIGQVAEF